MAQDNLKPLEQLLEVAEAIAAGDFSKEVIVDSEGILAQLASELNKTVRNLRVATPSVTQVAEQTPSLASTAQTVAELMDDSTQTVLDSADEIVNICKGMEDDGGQNLKKTDQGRLKKIKELSLNIISSQSYQDNARQKLKKMEGDLEMIRDILIEALIIMKIRDTTTAEEIQDKREQLRQVTATPPESIDAKQDLVDQLLSEFGL